MGLDGTTAHVTVQVTQIGLALVVSWFSDTSMTIDCNLRPKMVLGSSLVWMSP